ncbi:MAG: phenylalanine--tRNA ligase subunit beta, partial [Acidimicrobiia bacterium]
VSMRERRAKAILGKSLSLEEMADSLRRLELPAEIRNGSVEVTVPTRRQDITIEEDLVEEVARVHGYDNIPTSLPTGRNRRGGLTRDQKVMRQIRQSLVAGGLSEAHTNTFISSADLDRVGFPEHHEARRWLTVSNPINQEDSILRSSLLPGLMDSLARNVSRRVLRVGLFEIGNCIFSSSSVLPDEKLTLCMVMTGEKGQLWQEPSREQDFFDLKGVVEAMLSEFSIAGSFVPASTAPFHPTRAAELMIDGRSVGFLGEIAPATQRRYDILTRVLAAELLLSPIVAAAMQDPALEEPPKFPEVLLDLAVVVPDEVASADVIGTSKQAGGELLESVRIFDVYTGAQIESGRKSLALALVFRHPQRTLKEDEAQQAWEAIATAITNKHGGSVRR